MARTWSPLLSSCMMMDWAANPEEVAKAGCREGGREGGRRGRRGREGKRRGREGGEGGREERERAREGGREEGREGVEGESEGRRERGREGGREEGEGEERIMDTLLYTTTKVMSSGRENTYNCSKGPQAAHSIISTFTFTFIFNHGKLFLGSANSLSHRENRFTFTL